MNQFTKKYFNLLALLFFVFTVSCKLKDEAANADDSDQLPTNIEQKGVKGSWTHAESDTEPLVLSQMWFIETNQTRVAKICAFGDHKVTALVRVSSSIQGSVLTINESANREVTEGSMICAVSLVKNTFYTLSIPTINTLQISRAGVTTNFTRMEPL